MAPTLPAHLLVGPSLRQQLQASWPRQAALHDVGALAQLRQASGFSGSLAARLAVSGILLKVIAGCLFLCRGGKGAPTGAGG